MNNKKNKKEKPVQENHTYEVEITDMSHQGLGVAHVEGYPLFIPRMHCQVKRSKFVSQM